MTLKIEKLVMLGIDPEDGRICFISSMAHDDSIERAMEEIKNERLFPLIASLDEGKNLLMKTIDLEYFSEPLGGSERRDFDKRVI